MNQLEKLIQKQSEIECELNIIKSEISTLQLTKDELERKQYKVNVLKTLLNKYQNNQIYLCKSNQASAFREAENLLQYTWYKIVRDKDYYENNDRDDYEITVFSPIIDEYIPNELLSDCLTKYIENLEIEIKQLENRLMEE
jgi:hypothetical protein